MHPMAFHFRFPAFLAVGLAVALACGACSKDGDVATLTWHAAQLIPVTVYCSIDLPPKSFNDRFYTS